jgi:type IV pilus assembly protein PilM
MSTPKRIFTLSCGSQTVSLAEFRPDKKGALQLHAIETRELIPDPAADATRVAQAALAIGEMVESMKGRDSVARITLPAQSTFSRMVKLPAMSGADLQQTVMFEAKQNIPYPLEEVVWDHRIVYETQDHEPEVLIAAAKTDLLEEWTAAVAGAAMQPNVE